MPWSGSQFLPQWESQNQPRPFLVVFEKSLKKIRILVPSKAFLFRIDKEFNHGSFLSCSRQARMGFFMVFSIQPDRMQRVQTRIRLLVPWMVTRIFLRFGEKVLLVLLFAWLTLCPAVGPFPQISQTLAIGISSKLQYEN